MRTIKQGEAIVVTGPARIRVAAGRASVRVEALADSVSASHERCDGSAVPLATLTQRLRTAQAIRALVARRGAAPGGIIAEPV